MVAVKQQNTSRRDLLHDYRARYGIDDSFDLDDAINIANVYGILDKDFHALTWDEKSVLEDLAIMLPYRAPANRSGSKLRYFHAHLVRSKGKVKSKYRYNGISLEAFRYKYLEGTLTVNDILEVEPNLTRAQAEKQLKLLRSMRPKKSDMIGKREYSPHERGERNGGSRAVRYVLYLNGDSYGEWYVRARYGAKGYGTPTKANLEKAVAQWEKSFNTPSGSNYHIGKDRPLRVREAYVYDQQTGRKVAEWVKPMFTIVDSRRDTDYLPNSDDLADWKRQHTIDKGERERESIRQQRDRLRAKQRTVHSADAWHELEEKIKRLEKRIASWLPNGETAIKAYEAANATANPTYYELHNVERPHVTAKFQTKGAAIKAVSEFAAQYPGEDVALVRMTYSKHLGFTKNFVKRFKARRNNATANPAEWRKAVLIVVKKRIQSGGTESGIQYLHHLRQSVRLSQSDADWLNRQITKLHTGNKPLTRNATANDFVQHQKVRLEQLAQMFQGEANGDKRRVLESDYTPKRKYRLGYLKLLKIKDRGRVLPITVNGDDKGVEAYLAADLRNNLLILGKDARLEDIKLPPKGQLRYLGELIQVDYVTAKKHIGGGKLIHFYHKLGEVTGEHPNLFVDDEGFLIIQGGGYDVWDVGIVN